MKECSPSGKSYPVEREDTLLPFLLAHVAGKSRNNIKSLLSRKQVKVNGKTCTRFDHPLLPGQTVAVLPPPAGKESPKAPFPILYEDEELVVIDKPAGLLSIATDREKTRTAYRLMNEYVRASNPSARIFVVHRLDRDTSGVLVFAKTERMKLALQDNWETLVQKRGYLAIVEGSPAQAGGTIHTWLHETKTHLVYSGPRSREGKEAVTHYQVLDTTPEYALLSVWIDTGRKNQIRVHLKELGCPVAGDKKYGASTDPLGRLGLHAGELELRHPVTGDMLRFTAKTPKEVRRLFPGAEQRGKG